MLVVTPGKAEAEPEPGSRSQKNEDLTWFNLIAIWSPTTNIPNLHCALLATDPSYTYTSPR